jgi:hypothetical protein
MKDNINILKVNFLAYLCDGMNSTTMERRFFNDTKLAEQVPLSEAIGKATDHADRWNCISKPMVIDNDGKPFTLYPMMEVVKEGEVNKQVEVSNVRFFDEMLSDTTGISATRAAIKAAAEGKQVELHVNLIFKGTLGNATVAEFWTADRGAPLFNVLRN